MKDLEEAIRLAKLVVKSTLKDHPNQAVYLTNLGNQLGCWYKRTGEMKDLNDICSNLLEA